ncbi:probable disease resistance protein At4g27220 [Carya illinoinensis]|uniref:probable disease resistance protein At4g27220 n=1 Tax=Carya illinoinensis TaxID=32201 RepID=UPI001C71AB02|nr:probable disease resistance protein At4g27220 [Carya illinoinensis]
MDIVPKIMGKIGEISMALIGKHLGYLIYYEQNTKALENNLQKLHDRRVGVEQSITAAELRQEVTSPEVKSWLTKVEQITKDLENDNTKRKCLNGWCPNPKARYSSSRNAKKKTQAIGELLQEGRNYGGVYNVAPPPETRSSLSFEDFKHFESRTSIINDVLIALRDDMTNIIAICGMGGIGKTEMAKEIATKAKADNLFDKVVIAVVSQSLDLRRIQSEVAEKLGLTLNQESIDGRANALYSRLVTYRNVLVILDDIWEPLNLKDVGIPYGDQHKSCKLLITSRSEETCDLMKIQKIFSIKPLSELETWNLFREMAGNCIETPCLHPIANDVAKECGGLPVAIVTIGRALENKSKDNWIAALEQLRKSIPKNIRNLDKKVYSSIRLSYEFLESDEARSCFLLCCLFPEDHNIPIEDLVRYGVGRKLFDQTDTIAEARRRVDDIVGGLRRSNLLLDSEDEEHVKMHDVVRDVAISIASNEHGFMVRCDNKMEEWPQNDRYELYAAISLFSQELKRHPDGLECPKLELLQISSSFSEYGERIPETFPANLFRGMKELKILSFRCMSSLSLPSSIRVLQNLRMLRLEYCELEDVSAIEALLKLEMLSFHGSQIEELPREIQNLTFLTLLDLSECGRLKRIPPGVLSSLSRLEELYMGLSFECWESLEENGKGINASAAELCSLQHLMALDIRIPIKLLPKDLYLEKSLMKFRISVTDEIETSKYWKPSYLLENTLGLDCNASDIAESQTIRLMLQKAEVLYLIYMHDLVTICHSQVAVGSFGSLRFLNLRGCHSLKNAFPLSIARGLLQLQQLIIDDCSVMEEIFSEEENDDEAVLKTIQFPQLYQVSLQRLPKLIAFCKGIESSHVIVAQQPSLNQEVEGQDISHKLLSSISIFWAPNLKDLDMSYCESLEVVFDLEGLAVEENRQGFIALSQLRDLSLKYSDKLRHVWKNIPRGFQGFQNLSSICLEGCSCLQYLFTPSIAKLLVGLESVSIYQCSEIENILEVGEEEDAAEIIVFPKLSSFKLSFLKKLKSFCRPSYYFEWPSMHIISLRNCPNLITFGSEIQSTTKPKKINVGLDSRLQDTGTTASVKDAPDYLDRCLACVPRRKKLQEDEPNVNDIDIQTELQSLIPSSLIKSLQNLEELKAKYCYSLEAIFELEGGLNLEKSSAFAACNKLERLRLWILPKLEHIWKVDGPQEITGFHELRKLVVGGCHSLKYLFSPSTAKLLVKLEKIKVTDCNEMEAILAKARDQNEKSEVTFPKVHTLSLAHLPKLKCFCVEANAFKWPSLTKVKVVGCDKLKMFVPTEVETPPEQEFHGQILHPQVNKEDKPNVNDRDIQTELRSLIPSSLIKSLQNLEELTAEYCNSLEAIFELEGGLNLEKSSAFAACNKLERLRLWILPKLEHIWKVDGPQEITGFHELRLLVVGGCHSLKYLFSPSIAKLLGKLEQIEVMDCNEMEAILGKARDQNEKSEVTFPKVHTLSLVRLPKLECFCVEANAFKWPSLTKVIVVGCDKLKMFVPTKVETPPELMRVDTGFRKFQYMVGDLNATIQHMMIKCEESHAHEASSSSSSASMSLLSNSRLQREEEGVCSN